MTAPRTVLAFALALTLPACGGGGGGGGSSSDAEPCPVVHIQQFGDSTQRHQSDNLQAYLDRVLGEGRASVTNLGTSDTTAVSPLPEPVDPDAITTANWGINDARRGVSVDQYKAALRALSPAVFITPNPPNDNYAPAMREVAAELRRPVVVRMVKEACR